MTCATAEERALEVFDAEAPPRDADALHAHLRHCPGCSARVERLRRFHARLRRQRHLAPLAPEALRERVREALEAAHRQESARTGDHRARTDRASDVES